MAKTEFQLRDIAKILEKSAGAFQDPPKIAAPHTTITDLADNPRQLPDPAKTLKPVLGNERIKFKDLVLEPNEKGPNGAAVHKMIGEPRIRFVGEWVQFTNNNATRFLTQNPLSGEEFIEVTFQGTGLNLLWIGTSGTSDVRAKVDTDPEGANIVPSLSGVLGSRQYRANVVLPVVDGLPYGTHTVRLRGDAAGQFFEVNGVEILNEEIDIQVPQGEIFSNGRKIIQSNATTTPYNSGFDGSPTLNGRGGRVLVYKKPDDERVYKAIQQVDNAQANLASADHSNEEIIRKVKPREFGSNRSDDFSTLAQNVTADRAFALDDGTTMLVGDDIRFSSALPEGLFPISTNDFFTFVFVGTGLDVVVSDASAVDSWSIFIDGVDVGDLLFNQNVNGSVAKIVSGMPYGTHTVKFQRNASTGATFVVDDFIMYGPKKPDIPSDAEVIRDYNLMADYSPSSTVSGDALEISQGVIRKSVVREKVYTGTWAASLDTTNLQSTGWRTLSNVNGSTVEYTFLGTGLDFRYTWSSAPNARVRLNGVLLGATGTVNVLGGSYSTGTSIITESTNTLFQLTDLPYGLYTISFEKTAGTNFIPLAMEIHTPIHFPNTQVGSLSMDGEVPVLEQSSESDVDLGKAKAWLLFDHTTSTIIDSKNISAVLDVGTGQLLVYFEKPFKSEVKAAGMAQDAHMVHINQPGVAAFTDAKTNVGHTIRSTSGVLVDRPRVHILYFGELADEGDE